MTTDAAEVVRVEGLVKDFRPGLGLRSKRILHGIDFSVHENEIFGFVGPNGAGKTTTLKVLMGLIKPTAGGATILGHEADSGTTSIDAECGLKQLIGYATELRSQTRGRGQFVMEFDRFDVL